MDEDEDDRDNLLVVDLFLVFHVSCLLVLLSQLVLLVFLPLQTRQPFV